MVWLRDRQIWIAVAGLSLLQGCLGWLYLRPFQGPFGDHFGRSAVSDQLLSESSWFYLVEFFTKEDWILVQARLYLFPLLLIMVLVQIYASGGILARLNDRKRGFMEGGRRSLLPFILLALLTLLFASIAALLLGAGAVGLVRAFAPPFNSELGFHLLWMAPTLTTILVLAAAKIVYDIARVTRVKNPYLPVWKCLKAGFLFLLRHPLRALWPLLFLIVVLVLLTLTLGNNVVLALPAKWLAVMTYWSIRWRSEY